MTVYNARAQQKLITILFCGAFEFLLLLAFFLGEFYKNSNDVLIFALIMFGIVLFGFIIYFLLNRFACSAFVFDKNGFVRKLNKRIVLQVKWEEVISIGTYKIYDFLKFEIGPTFLGIDYYDENHNQRSLNVAFSDKDARKLKFSQLNEKLDKIV